jgi:hypothetical protein
VAILEKCNEKFHYKRCTMRSLEAYYLKQGEGRLREIDRDPPQPQDLTHPNAALGSLRD